jgi:polyisoprenyl-teichoic acid--peptidoglycan teichoic acid transferase
MAQRHRRFLTLVLLGSSLFGLLAVGRVGLAWQRAIADIDAMIVTPVNLQPEDNPAQQSLTPTAAPADADQPAVAAPNTDPAADAPQIDAEMTILLLGTDARPTDVEPTRTDAIVLVRIARDSGRVSMLSIPRDLWVDYSTGGEGRINAAYGIGEMRYGPGGGAALSKATISDLVGLPIDHFVLIDFKGFQTLINRLGGITVDVPYEIYDPAYPTDDYRTIEVYFAAGTQHMDGDRALIYARTRHADSDFGRNQRQQQVLTAMFSRAADLGLLEQLTNVDEYTGALRNYVKTDLSRRDMLGLANFARGLAVDDILRYAIDSRSIVELQNGGTFRVDAADLEQIVAQFTGRAVSTAGGE